MTDLLALFAGVVSTTPAELWAWPTPTTTPSTGTGLEVSRVATAPAPTQRLSHELEGPAAPSRHMPAVFAVPGPLPQSPGHGLSCSKACSPQGARGKDAMETDDAFCTNLSDGLLIDNVVLRHVFEIPSTTATYYTSVHSSIAVPNTRIDESMEFDNGVLEYEVDLELPAKYSAETSGRDQSGDDLTLMSLTLLFQHLSRSKYERNDQGDTG